MPPEPSKVSLGIILSRIDTLQAVTKEIKDTTQSLHDKFERFNLDYVAEHTRLVARVEEAHKRVDNLKSTLDNQAELIKALTTSIQPMVAGYKVTLAIAGILLSLVLALFFGILTHTVNIVVP